MQTEGCGIMKEYRLTFATDNFGVISQVLVDMGVGFTVELAEPAATEAPAKQRVAKKPAKAAPKKKKAGGSGSAPKRSQSSLAGAERALARLVRGDDEGSSGASPAGETSSAKPTASEGPDETGG